MLDSHVTYQPHTMHASPSRMLTLLTTRRTLEEATGVTRKLYARWHPVRAWTRSHKKLRRQCPGCQPCHSNSEIGRYAALYVLCNAYSLLPAQDFPAILTRTTACILCLSICAKISTLPTDLHGLQAEMMLMPPRYGCKTSGTRMLPSSC